MLLVNSWWLPNGCCYFQDASGLLLIILGGLWIVIVSCCRPIKSWRLLDVHGKDITF